MRKLRISITTGMRRFFMGICEELLADHTVDIYLVEKGNIIDKKKGVPFIPPPGSIIEIESDRNLFKVDIVQISNGFGVIHLYGHQIPYTSEIAPKIL